MKRKLCVAGMVMILCIFSFSFEKEAGTNPYESAYRKRIELFKNNQKELIGIIEQSGHFSEGDKDRIGSAIAASRMEMKKLDFWLRYLEPISYKKINGPLPVEWETEVFEKFEKPYKREGAGLTLAAQYLEEPVVVKDTLVKLIQSSYDATGIYLEDSITENLSTYHHFFLCNRLYLLNLAAIYSTGFECPLPEQIIPELRTMIGAVDETYNLYNNSFPDKPLTKDYLSLYAGMAAFVQAQKSDYTAFDHYLFIRDYVNPLFAMNQEMIRNYKVITRSNVDYSLTKTALSIFDKSLYNGQNSKGIFLRVKDSAALAEIDRLGKLLFYDPILSGNNMRSCASCHKPDQHFTEVDKAASMAFDKQGSLSRNTPSLINASFNHLIMMDGIHYSLQHQTKSVITNAREMNADEAELLKKVLSCKEYKQGFTTLLQYTPQETEITMDHLASAITFYYGKFSKATSPFDRAMLRMEELDADARHGFNLFMSKAQCGTCHFVPQFNGVKPPFVGSEFEVLGVPSDTAFTSISADSGRYGVNPAYETLHAFRTGSIRNAEHTMPYMHNGVFNTLEEVIEFYNNGGGAGRGLRVDNQTLSSDSLKLTITEKKQLVAFIKSLTESVPFEKAPLRLPSSRMHALNGRKPGGIY